MYYSNALCNNYKTVRGLKTQLTKNLKKANEELEDVTNCIKKGWNTYLGDNIFNRKRDLSIFIFQLKQEIKHAQYL